MKISTRSILMATVAVLSAGVLSFAQTVTPPPPPRPVPTVHLVAYVKSLVPQPPSPTGRAASLDAPPPTAAPLAIPIAPNLANTIDSAYLAIEPWVEYGFAVAASVVAWIPYVGFASGFIMDGYFFGESLVASGVFNFTDWLRGDGGVVENLVDFGIDVGLAFVWLGIDVVNTFIPLPPCNCYPPRPPVQGPFLAAADTLMAPAETLTAAASGADEAQQPDKELANKQNAEDVTTDQSEQGTTGEDGTDVDGTELDATATATGVDATGVDATDESDVQGDDQAAVDISASAQEDATAGSEDSTEDATTDSSAGTVGAQGEVHESTSTEPIVAAAEAQPAAAAADDATAQTPSTPDGNTENSDAGDNTAGD